MGKRALIVGAGALATVAAAAVAIGVLTPGEQEPDATPVSHEGMVEGAIWVADEASDSLTAIDAATHEVVATLTGIRSPHNVQVSPDGAKRVGGER